MSGPTSKGFVVCGALCAAVLARSGETDWPTYNTSSWIRQGSVFLGGIEEGENLVANAGFEKGEPLDARQRRFPGWSWWNCSASFDTGDKREGKQSLKLVQAPGRLCVASTSVTLKKGKKYRMAAWLKTDGKGTKVRGYILHETKPFWKTIGLGWASEPKWVSREVTFVSPFEGARTLRFDVLGGKGTTAWLDGLRVVELKSSIPSNLVPNGGFERPLEGWQTKHGAVATDKVNKYSGKASLKLTMDNDAKALDLYHGAVDLTGYECAMAWKAVDIPLSKDRVYRLSGMAQGDGNNRVFVQLIGDKGDVVQTNRPKHYEWDALQATFTMAKLKKASSRITRIEVCMHDKAGGFANLDDLRLEVATPMTSIGPGTKVVEDFESGKIDCLSPAGARYAPLPEAGPSAEKPHRGRVACRVAYRFDAGRPGAWVRLQPTYAARRMPTGRLTRMALWVFGDGSGIRLRLTHRYRRVPEPVTVDWRGWRRVELKLDGLGWESSRDWWTGVVVENPTDQAKAGVIWLDDIEVTSLNLRSSDALSLGVIEDNPLSVYRPGEQANVTVRVRNNTNQELHGVRARLRIADFWRNTVRQEEKTIAAIAAQAEQAVFALRWTPSAKGVYSLLVEAMSDESQTLNWRTHTLGAMEPNKGWKPAPGEDLFFGICPTHLVSWRSPKLIGLLGVTMVRVHHFNGMVGPKDDPHRWDYYDRLNSHYRANGMTAHQKAVAGLPKENTEEYVFDIVSHYRGRAKYFSLGGEEDPPAARDPSHVQTFIDRFKPACKGARRADPDCKIGLALLNWYLVYSAHRDGKPLAFIERWLAELKGLYDFFPYQIRGGHAQLLGYEKARQWYFNKCGVNVPVWANEGGVGGPREAVVAPVMMRTFGYQNFTYFCDKDYGRDRTMGLLDIWDQPKAAYFAYNTTIRMLKNTQPKGRADFGEAVVAYAFQRGAESIYCLWTEWSIGKAIRLKGPVQSVTLVDIMGNEQTVRAQDGAVTIALKDTFPVFIVSPADLTPVK